MTQKEMNGYIERHEGSIQYGVRLLRRSLREVGRRYSSDDMEDVAQELRIVMYKCLLNYNPCFRTTLRTYIESSIEKYISGIIRTQCGPKHTSMYFSASLHSPAKTIDGCDELGNTIINDRLPDEPRLDAVIFSDSLLELLDKTTRERIKAWLSGMTLKEIGIAEGFSSEMERLYIAKGIDRLREIVDNQGKE